MVRLSSRNALAIIAALLLMGCGQSQGAFSSPVVPTVSALRDPRGSGEVQYFSNAGSLLEFDYPKGESPIGQITGVSYPAGECTKGARTFWVVASGADEVEEFKAGGKSPIKTLSDPNFYPVGCSVDPVTGNLAASNIFSISGGQGSVAVYVHAKGSPTLYEGPDLHYVYFVGYDDSGNLYADGESSSGSFVLAKLAKGGSSLQTVTTSNTVSFPGSVQWDGRYMTVGDQVNAAIYRYHVIGSRAQLKGTVLLEGSSDCGSTWIARPYVYCADAGGNAGLVYEYPAGGYPIATLTGPFDVPAGVVSLRIR